MTDSNRNLSMDSAVTFDAKDRPLRQDVGRLGSLLGEFLRELAPAGVFETVEAARLAARARRRGDAGGEARLQRSLADLDPDRAFAIVRAFSAYFGVVNTAEQVHRMRRRIDYRREGRAQGGSLVAALTAIRERGGTLDDVRAGLSDLVVEPVFTAHPTESVRRSLLKKQQRLALALVERFAADAMDPVALEVLDERIALEIASGWQTDEELPGRPTVAEEVEHVLFFLSEVLYRIVPALHEDLERAAESVFGEPLTVERPLVRFSSWVGGDMDGNPNVGADTMRATLARHLELALRRYRQELLTLHEHLSQSSTRAGVDDAVHARVADYTARFPEEAAEVPARYADMPYRQLLWLMTARLERKGRGVEGGYGAPAEFRADLERIEDSLRRHGGARAGLALVRRALWRVDTFGFHLASLDVRQDAEVHRRVVGELLGDPEFSDRSREERTQRLAAALAAAPSVVDPQAYGEEAQRTLDVFVAFDEVRAGYGDEALGPYIISMAQGPDDALAVLYLARVAGCVDEDGRVPLDVSPLFETVDDLERGPDTLEVLVQNDLYAAHLAARGKRQMVMLGYSDSNKDGGIAASRVGLYRAQERLVARAEAHGVALTFFHGRGGSISRGGSKPRAALMASPPGSIGGHARATEQGEVIGAKFGLRGIASRTLEVSLGAVLERSSGGDPARAASEQERALAETLARASRARYRELVHDDPDFPALFQGMTPIDVIERLQIGSRPARRREMRGVQDLRAIPWVFSWTQCRAVLPGWFGVGSGLRAAIAEHGLDAVRQAAQDWPFLDTFCGDVEMVLAKSDLEIAARYAELAGDVGARLFPVIEEEHARTVEAVLEVREAGSLLERDPTLRRSILLRNPYVDPVSFLQVDLLARWRAGGREDRALERALFQTVRGIARGLRNTG